MQGGSLQGGASNHGGRIDKVEKVNEENTPFEVSPETGAVIINSTTPVTIHLPHNAPQGKLISVKAGPSCSQAAAITIFPPVGKTIDGEPLFILTFSNSAITLLSDEGSWLIL